MLPIDEAKKAKQNRERVANHQAIQAYEIEESKDSEYVDLMTVVEPMEELDDSEI